MLNLEREGPEDRLSLIKTSDQEKRKKKKKKDKERNCILMQKECFEQDQKPRLSWSMWNFRKSKESLSHPHLHQKIIISFNYEGLKVRLINEHEYVEFGVEKERRKEFANLQGAKERKRLADDRGRGPRLRRRGSTERRGAKVLD